MRRRHVGDDVGMEMGAIAWSYAAAMHLGVAPSVLFHDVGLSGWRAVSLMRLQKTIAVQFAIRE